MPFDLLKLVSYVFMEDIYNSKLMLETEVCIPQVHNQKQNHTLTQQSEISHHYMLPNVTPAVLVLRCHVGP
jgi:hypothetical protein